MKTSDRLLRLAQEATQVRKDAEGLFDARATRAAKTLRESAIATEQELWAAYSWAIYAEIPETYVPFLVVR